MQEVDVFISYAHSDAALAASVQKALEAADLKVWIDDRIDVGDSFQRAIGEALEAARCVLVLWSAQAVDRGFVRDEARLAGRRGTLLPCFLADGVEDEVPFGLQETQGLRLVPPGGSFTPEQLAELVTGVKQKLSTPSRRKPLAEAARSLRARLEEHLRDRYDIVHELGRGGSSVVFRARSVEAANSIFAIKVTTTYTLLLNDGLYDSFVKASETAGRLRHPNIVSVNNVERGDDLFWSVTRFVDGRSLESTIKGQGRLAPATAQSILVQVAGALAHAHGQGVFHHALRPGKIIVDHAGNAFVTDFGTAYAREIHKAGGQADRLLGQPTYMSPEQCRGDSRIAGSSDQYSLGVIAYQMLTGAAPFAGQSPLEVMRKHCETPPPPLGEVAAEYPALEAIVLRMLAKEPSSRYASLGVVADKLKRALSRTGSDRDVAAASYRRCCDREYFLAHFYDAFIQSDPRVAMAFAKIDVDRQVDMLRRALDMLFNAGPDSELGQQTLARIAASHRAFDPALFDAFNRSLLATVEALDTDFGPETKRAWEQVLADLVRRLMAVGRSGS